MCICTMKHVHLHDEAVHLHDEAVQLHDEAVKIIKACAFAR